MLLLDVNVVVAAHRADHPDHEPVRVWFEELLADDQAFAGCAKRQRRPGTSSRTR